MSRNLAACIGIFGLANSIAGMFRSELDANIWWIDTRALPDGAARVLIGVACVLLIAYSLSPEMSPIRKTVSVSIWGMMSIICVANCATFYSLLLRGMIRSALPVPLSAVVASVLLWLIVDVCRGRLEPRETKWSIAIPTLCLCLIGFPLAQIFLFGKTNYSRSADVAIVFGARAYADGSASVALADRVRTACDLYKEGVVNALIFSGGPSDGVLNEADVMKSLALKWGVQDENIFLDREGLNTRATLENVRRLIGEPDAKNMRILAVSHFYHLPRIKLESQRLGLNVFTVPATESYTLTKMPLLVGREVAALWKYYLLPPPS